jgi:hypothetical protein
LGFFQGLEQCVESGSELASDARDTAGRRGCIGVLVFTLLLVDVSKSGRALDRVLSAGGGRSHGLHRLLSGDNGIFILGVGLDSDGLGGEETLDERVDRAGILPAGGLGVPSQQGNEVRAESIDVPLDETFGRVGDRPTVMIDGECRESGSVGISELEC